MTPGDGWGIGLFFLDGGGKFGSGSSLRDCLSLIQADHVHGIDMCQGAGGVPMDPAYVACEQALCGTR